MNAIDLEPGPTVDGFRVAAVVHQEAVGAKIRGAPQAWGMKVPLAILIADGASIHAFDAHCNAIPISKVERILPGAPARFGQVTRGAPR